MNKTKLTISLLLTVTTLLVAGAVSYYVAHTNISGQPAQNQPAQNNPPVQQNAPLAYHNAQYGFDFSLPETWRGYTIVTQTWTGQELGQNAANKTQTGPELLIRHPAWTAQSPRQDIPIMIFTLAQWDLIQKEELSVSAAPIPPSELGKNATYVFALPARYNYAFPTGFEEVQTIIEGNPLHAF